MIVRILGEAQYLVPDDARATLAGLDDALVAAVDSGDESTFTAALDALASTVREVGETLADDDFAPSDLVVPFADASLAETKGLLAESGDTGGSDDR
jgi:hypothetical protein